MKKVVTMIPGDGIGPEISEVMMEIVSKECPDISWEVVEAGQKVYEETGQLIPERVYKSLEKNRVGLKGPITTPIGKGFRSINVVLRKKYDLYCNLRPIRSIAALNPKYPNVDLIIFRENTEDLYAGIEEQVSENCAKSIKIITREASERIARSALEYAREYGKNKVTVVTKANIMKLSDGLFLDATRAVAKDYPEIELEEVLVDNMAMQLVINPQQYSVIVTENLYGDILSDLCAGLVGGLGMVPGANLGVDMAVFESVHGSAPQIAGKGIANPTAMLLTACMMLDHLDEKTAASRIRKALISVLSKPKYRTADLGGSIGMRDYAGQIMACLEKEEEA